MLGEGPLWEDLKKEGDDRILLPGFKTNVYDYLIASDYYISASDVEGLANTLLESMTVGLPMLLSDIPSHQEVLSKMSVTTGYISTIKTVIVYSTNRKSAPVRSYRSRTRSTRHIPKALYSEENVFVLSKRIY